MSEDFDRRLGYQPDIYQRYGFLAGLTQALLEDGEGILTTLDVGCGPVRLTETFLSSRFTVVRADVSQFGDPEIVELKPGEPLPFETGSFDLTLGLEVIEHLPPPVRPGFIRELQRVARRATIVSCPVATPESISAEREFAKWARAISGRAIDFLAEHEQYGLPDASDVISWFARPSDLLVVENAPLDDWQILNLLDYICAADLGDSEDKRRLNAMVNAHSRFARADVAHYRRFFAAFASRTAAASASRFAETARDPGPTNIAAHVQRYAVALLALHDGLKRRFARELDEKETRVGQLERHIADLSAGVTDLRDFVARKDEHISGLDAHIRVLDSENGRLAGVVSQLQEDSSQKTATIAKLESFARQVHGRLSSNSQAAPELSEAEDSADLLSSTLDSLSRTLERHNHDVEQLTARMAAAEHQLQASLASRSWKITNPLPATADAVRRMMRTIRRSSRDWPSARSWPKERWRRRRAYRAIVASGLFDAAWYRERYPDVAAAGVDPLTHYLSSGAREGRDPCPNFDTAFYLRSNPDVTAARLNPLVHFVLYGRQEGRLARVPSPVNPEAQFYVPPQGLLPWFNPLNVEVSASLSDEPRVNVLLPALGMRNLSGGPNTALVLAGRLAAAGIRVRLVSTDLPLDQDSAPLWAHLRHLLGSDLPRGLEVADGHDRSRPMSIGKRDVFLATAWWTAQMAKYAVRHTVHPRFIYLIQDYEALFHAASTSQALAEETYSLDHIPVINSSWLFEFLLGRRVGRFADERFSGEALVFEPAVDKRVFYPRERAEVNGRRRILFYARPTGALRNLFELGVASLQKAVAEGVLTPDEWEFVGMGEQFTPVPLGRNAVLVPAPWLDLTGYARQMRESDILLSLMLSPHPSYPPLEMAASGGIAVTTSYEGKSAGQLASLSANIVATEPTLEAITAGLATARSLVPDWAARVGAARVSLPQTWSDSLGTVVPSLVTRLLELQGSPRLSTGALLNDEPAAASINPVYRGWPSHRYDIYRRAALARRREDYVALERPGLLSFLTPVWNADPRQLEELAESVLDQDLPHNYEWVVLDNGSDRAETRELLMRFAHHPSVRLFRSEENLGIIGGTRFCLERAKGRYVATVDHDDLLTPDCVRVVTHFLVNNGYPALAYSDEDKVQERSFRDPYFKPDWDPVLFTASCYIAHLIVFDREQALTLGAYTDRATEGSHDWDTFMRFMLAKCVPAHIPEVLYAWRMHTGSTAGNIQSKPYVASSQQRVLQKFIEATARPDLYRIEASPFFDGTPDWRIQRRPADARPITTLFVQEGGTEPARLSLDPEIFHDVRVVQAGADLSELESLIERCADTGRLVHIWWAGTEVEGTEWAWEAMAQFELFPDTAVVGGRIHWKGRIQEAASYFGFGRGCDSPDQGRSVDDPGYFAQMWKPRSVSAVPVQHCVVEPAFFREFLKRYGHADLRMHQLGPWLGAFARARGRRVIYSPFLSARSREGIEQRIQPVEWAAFRTVHRAVIPETKYLSPRLGLDTSTPYQPVSDEERRAQLGVHVTADGGEMLGADRLARRALYPSVPAFTRVALLTSVYERTPSLLFERMSESLFRQSRPFDEWVLLVNGPIPDDVERIVNRCESDSRIKLVRVAANIGIVGAMRRCLESASAEYVIPVDADDLLEEDALKVLEATLARNPADVVYSDEDMLSEEVSVARYSRPDFDPVLNLETSYIWHLCAFRRERALELGVYSDSGAEFCHDWDTVHRFANDGATIIHIPHVLYRWRTHAMSQSHSGVQNQGTVASTAHLLQQVIARQPRPELYELRTFPLFRGAEEWYIARRAVAPPIIDVLVLSGEGTPLTASPFEGVTFPFRRIVPVSIAAGRQPAFRDLAAALDGTSTYVAVLSDCVSVCGDAWVWEAIRLFELHQDIAVVSGRVLGPQDTVVDAGRHFGSGNQGGRDFRGLRRSDPGPFAIALKPHSIDLPSDSPMMVDTRFMLDALECGEEWVPMRLAQLLAKAAAKERRRIAYSPLLEARLKPSIRG